MYAFSLGEIANIFTKKYVQHKGKLQRMSAITEKEFAWMNRLGNGDGEIDRYEFAMLWFLRNGLIKPDHVDECNIDFQDLDADQNGIFSKSEMQASAFFNSYDDDHDGALTLHNMTAIARTLQELPSVEYPGKFMLDPGIIYDRSKIEADMFKYDASRTTVLKKKSSTSSTRSLGRNLEVKEMDVDDVEVEVVSLNRKEFMKWWSEDFMAYVGTDSTNLVYKMRVDIQQLLDAIEDVGEVKS